MGFLIVFDVNEPESFNRAMELHDLLKDFAEYRNVTPYPLGFRI